MSNNFNMNFDPVVRQQFAELTANYGLTVAQAFKLFANQAIKTGVLPLSFDWERVPALNSQTQQAVAQGQADYQAGRLDVLAPDDAIQALQALSHD